jgi:leucyl-tRNA synthetase
VDQTVLANEQVIDGRGWRTGALVEKREIPMYYLAITKYSEELLAALDTLPGWPERVKTMQANWIGKSLGVRAGFPYELDGKPGTLWVFTTRADTIMGVTFVAVAAEHPLAAAAARNNPALAAFIEECKRGSVQEADLATQEKKGMRTGFFVDHPLTGEKVEVWVGNYVLMTYGEGAVMGVPGHDERDFEFAKKYGLPIVQVIDVGGRAYSTDAWQPWYTEHGVCIHSGRYDGLDFEGSVHAIAADLKARGLGDKQVTWRLRDWGISRQRYWGCPIPLVHCPSCGDVPVPDDRLPVVLPEDCVPDGSGNPLNKLAAFLETDCPKCGKPAKRETDTMDTFVDSSWYFLRYTGLDPERPFDPERVATWMPVHQYTGGIEHAILHLLYARFFTKVLYDMGLVGFTEPFTSLLNQGMVIMYGHAMSKSRGNLVEPSAIIDEHGADVARLTMLFAGPFEDDVDWADVSPEGMARWIQRVWRTVNAAVADGPAGTEDLELARLAHRATAGVADDLERFRFNTAISKLMVLSNGLADAVRAGRASAAQRRDAAERLVLLLAPLAPFITEELWRGVLGNPVSVHVSPWPSFDPDLVRQERVTCVLQVDGKVRDRVEVATDASEEELRELAMASEKVRAALGERPVARVVVVPPKLVNLVTGR